MNIFLKGDKMNLRILNYMLFLKNRPLFLRFIREHGDSRITHHAIGWLRNLSEEAFNKDGNIVIAVMDGRRLVGLGAVSNYGLNESLAVVHRQYRQKDIGRQLIRAFVDNLGKFYGRVALDNIASLKMCFAAGLYGFKLTTGPTGKPTLWVGGGNIDMEDVDMME